ncbi:hypothetical protein HaLaN_25546 [Haematococcus lacustris]|uniref:Uncharacterized protein n=1 Tax=Haematococcus lacustris TaxID=44745 RepID=A0A6A0A530_HAELA|nr:hypothetical protein HaLaN_25546 [Haematococcus lacustris]
MQRLSKRTATLASAEYWSAVAQAFVPVWLDAVQSPKCTRWEHRSPGANNKFRVRGSVNALRSPAQEPLATSRAC